MFLKSYLTALVAFFLIDMLWLGFIAKSFYNKQLSGFISPNINWVAAIVFYLVFIAGLVVFVISPALKQGTAKTVFLYGMFFGLVTYATYDLTNLATLKNWPLIVTLVDLAWGALLGGLVSLITFLLVSKYS